MAKLKNPLLSLSAQGRFGKIISFVRRRGENIAEKKPVVPDAKTLVQLSWRHMFQKVVALWHALSAAEKLEWESLARPHHMTGYAYFLSQCLKPNPGIYLPLQGGKMSGDIDMDKNRITKLPAPVSSQDADNLTAREAAIAVHSALDTEVHGVGASTVCSKAELTDHASLPNAHHTPSVGAQYRQADAALFQTTPAIGTATYPGRVNDNIFNVEAKFDAIDEYAEVDFGEIAAFQRWRQYGEGHNNENGVWKIQYFDIPTQTWTDWVTGISTRAAETWSSYSTETLIYAQKIRLVATTIDTGDGGISEIRELEVIY